MACKILSVAVTFPAPLTYPVKTLPITVAFPTTVAPCVPVTSPARLPVKEAAEPVVF